MPVFNSNFLQWYVSQSCLPPPFPITAHAPAPVLCLQSPHLPVISLITELLIFSALSIVQCLVYCLHCFSVFIPTCWITCVLLPCFFWTWLKVSFRKSSLVCGPWQLCDNIFYLITLKLCTFSCLPNMSFGFTHQLKNYLHTRIIYSFKKKL